MGGCNGMIYYGCLYVDQLWVDESLRGQGYGTQLMQVAETLGKTRGCLFATVNTMDWEGLEFYKKLGYQIEFTRRGFRQLNEHLEKAKGNFTNPEQQIEAIAYAYWKFAFQQKEYYQLMYGLGMPGCDAVKQIPELSAFTAIILAPIKEMLARSKNETADPFLKLHTFWSTLHGLISINMMGRDDHRDELNAMVLKDFLNGFVSGMKG